MDVLAATLTLKPERLYLKGRRDLIGLPKAAMIGVDAGSGRPRQGAKG
ncbi:MAG: hypothetical protein MUE52_16135 [Tabrizicola sp.]|jgi:hypothetical protein|nr:hypothetical protein [Tabrizicola sp.]